MGPPKDTWVYFFAMEETKVLRHIVHFKFTEICPHVFTRCGCNTIGIPHPSDYQLSWTRYHGRMRRDSLDIRPSCWHVFSNRFSQQIKNVFTFRVRDQLFQFSASVLTIAGSIKPSGSAIVILLLLSVWWTSLGSAWLPWLFLVPKELLRATCYLGVNGKRNKTQSIATFQLIEDETIGRVRDNKRWTHLTNLIVCWDSCRARRSHFSWVYNQMKLICLNYVATPGASEMGTDSDPR